MVTVANMARWIFRSMCSSSKRSQWVPNGCRERTTLALLLLAEPTQDTALFRPFFFFGLGNVLTEQFAGHGGVIRCGWALAFLRSLAGFWSRTVSLTLRPFVPLWSTLRSALSAPLRTIGPFTLWAFGAVIFLPWPALTLWSARSLVVPGSCCLRTACRPIVPLTIAPFSTGWPVPPRLSASLSVAVTAGTPLWPWSVAWTTWPTFTRFFRQRLLGSADH